MHIEDLYKKFQQYPSVSTDTRNIANDSLFFALKGESFNGNEFAEQALQLGAKYVIIDESQYYKGEQYILVDDVLSTLQELAKYHRQELSIPFIGITGTNGKTTTKELLFAVLSEKYNTYATRGNLNNHIGVPLTLLSITAEHDIAIIEMGANHIGEIKFLCAIAQPTHGLITNVGKAHLEGFGSFEGVKQTKGELYDYLQDYEGTVFVQSDNLHLREMVNARHIAKQLSYGFSEQNDVIGRLIRANPYLSIAWKFSNSTTEQIVSTNLTGSYNTENFLAAIAVGKCFNVETDQINRGVSNYVPTNNRSQIIKTGRNTLIADFYNANASSMVAALENMQVLEANHKIIILGDMFEMGDAASAEHSKIVALAGKMTLERLIFVGEEFYKQQFYGAEFYRTTAEAKLHLSNISGSFVLLKASRGMAFEKLVEEL